MGTQRFGGLRRSSLKVKQEPVSVTLGLPLRFECLKAKSHDPLDPANCLPAHPLGHSDRMCRPLCGRSPHTAWRHDACARARST